MPDAYDGLPYGGKCGGDYKRHSTASKHGTSKSWNWDYVKDEQKYNDGTGVAFVCVTLVVVMFALWHWWILW